MNQSQQAKLLHSIKDGCVLTGFSHMTLYREINAGRLRSVKIGRRRMITPEALKAWISDRERATCGGAG